MRSRWIPLRSPHSLIQEDLWPNEWLILSACVLLNCTKRKQVELVIGRFMQEWNTPQKFLEFEPNEVMDSIKSLGFMNRRYDRLEKLAVFLTNEDIKEPRDLPGIGEYGARAYEIFCLGIIGDAEPNDGALALYWRWAVNQKKDIYNEPRSLLSLVEHQNNPTFR